MTILRVGTNPRYEDGWSAAFGKAAPAKGKSGKSAAKPAKAAKKKGAAKKTKKK